MNLAWRTITLALKTWAKSTILVWKKIFWFFFSFSNGFFNCSILRNWNRLFPEKLHIVYPTVQGGFGWGPGLLDLVAGSAHSRAVGNRWSLNYYFQPQAFYVSLKSVKYLQYQQQVLKCLFLTGNEQKPKY